MPAMSRVEQAFCRSGPWRSFSQRTVLPWVLHGRDLHGSVLEIGGGDGGAAEVLLRAAPQVSLTLSDYDGRMLHAAQSRLAPFGDRVTIEHADATQLPFENDSFDAVLSFIMLHHVIDWEAAVGEAVRVARPHGVVVGYDLTDTPLTRLIHTLDRSVARPMRPEALRERVRQLPVDSEVVTAWHGLVVRFALTKRQTSTQQKVEHGASAVTE